MFFLLHTDEVIGDKNGTCVTQFNAMLVLPMFANVANFLEENEVPLLTN